MKKLKKTLAIALAAVMLLSTTAMATDAGTAEGGYDYPNKYLWHDSSWFGGMLDYATLLQMNGGPGFDAETVVNSELGEAILNQMNGTFTYRGYDDPATFELWAGKGVTKTLYHTGESEAPYSVLAPAAALSGAGDKTYPVVVVFHGNGRNILDSEFYGFADLCASEDLIAVHPAWQEMKRLDGTLTSAKIIENILAELEQNGYPIDRTRVYAAGHSAGGVASIEAALERPDMIAAIAPAGCTRRLQKEASDFPAVEIPMYFVIGEYDFDQIPMTAEPAGEGVEIWSREGMIDSINCVLEMNGCAARLDLADCRAVAASGTNPVCSFMGIYGDENYTRTVNGGTNYFVEFKDSNGVTKVVFEGVSALPHWINPTFAASSWAFMSNFSRTASTPNVDVPQTGDGFSLWLSVAVLSSMGLLALLAADKKRKV